MLHKTQQKSFWDDLTFDLRFKVHFKQSLLQFPFLTLFVCYDLRPLCNSCSLQCLSLRKWSKLWTNRQNNCSLTSLQIQLHLTDFIPLLSCLTTLNQPQSSSLYRIKTEREFKDINRNLPRVTTCAVISHETKPCTTFSFLLLSFDRHISAPHSHSACFFFLIQLPQNCEDCKITCTTVLKMMTHQLTSMIHVGKHYIIIQEFPSGLTMMILFFLCAFENDKYIWEVTNLQIQIQKHSEQTYSVKAEVSLKAPYIL